MLSHQTSKKKKKKEQNITPKPKGLVLLGPAGPQGPQCYNLHTYIYIYIYLSLYIGRWHGASWRFFTLQGCMHNTVWTNTMTHVGRDPVCKVGHPGAEESERQADRQACWASTPFSSSFPLIPSILFSLHPSFGGISFPPSTQEFCC